MKIREYMKLHISQIPKKITDQYNHNNIFYPDIWVYIEVQKGLSCLKQARHIENDRLTSHLDNFGYFPTRILPGIQKHKYQPITFFLAVDNFGVKYFRDKHANQLLVSLCQLYSVTEDWTRSVFIVMTLERNYLEKYVNVSMPGYITPTLHRFQHKITFHHQDSPSI